MINALLVLALLGQEADVAVTSHGRRQGGEYELTVAGKGKGLRDHEIVSLTFRRLSNRMNWEDGALRSVPAEDEIRRSATVENNAFVHHERFALPGEVEVLISRSHADGAPSGAEPLCRVFRIASLPEEAFAIGSAAKRFDGALIGLRRMLDDLDAIRGESCPPARKRAQLQKRIDWRMNAYRQEIADSFLDASARTLSQLMADLESAIELERNGKDTAMMLSALNGKAFAWDEVRSQLDAIEAASLRERALLTVRAADAMAEEIASRVRSKETAGWARQEKDLVRTLDALRENDKAWRSGAAGEAYRRLVDGAGVSFEEYLSQAGEYLHAGAACLHCTKPDDGVFAELGQTLTDRSAAFETRLRSRN